MNIDVGQIVGGKYELVRLVGRGAMGEVWLATHGSLGGEFAVKLVDTSDDMEDDSAPGRFQLEAQIAAKLSRQTRHIVSVSDHGEEGDFAYLVMELLVGESLEQKIERDGGISLPEAVAIGLQVARALGLAHADGVFHRDLKPANVFLCKDEDGRLLVKLLDFGIARSIKPVRTRSPFVTTKDMVLGTPSYMSPEQARGLSSLDHRCDLWALGVVVYEALTGRIPFDGESVEDIFLSICTHRVVPIRSLRADLDPAVDAFFSRAFAPAIDARFASAQDLAHHLASLVDEAALASAFGGAPIGQSSVQRLLGARIAEPSAPDLAPPPSLPAITAGLARPPPRMESSPDLVVAPRRTGLLAALAVGALALLASILVFVLTRRDDGSGSALAATPSPPPPPVVSAPGPPVSVPKVITSVPLTASAAPSAPSRNGPPPPKAASPAPSPVEAPVTPTPPRPAPPKKPEPREPRDKSEVL